MRVPSTHLAARATGFILLAPALIAMTACASSNVALTRDVYAPGRAVVAAPAAPPAGFIAFCARDPQDCGLTAASSQVLDTASLRQQSNRLFWRDVFVRVRSAEQAEDAAAVGRAAPSVPDGGSLDEASLQVQANRQYWRQVFARVRSVEALDGQAEPATAIAPSNSGPLDEATLQTQANRQFWRQVFVKVRSVESLEAQAGDAGEIHAARVAPVDDAAGAGPQDDEAKLQAQANRQYWRQVFARVRSAEGIAAAASAPAEPASAAAPGVEMTDSTWRLLQAVNSDVNRLIVPRETRALSLGEDYWSTPISYRGALYGDCKEYVIEKRRRLAAAGIPAADLSIAIASVGGQGHAVLLVSTDQGEFVLDNLTSQVRPWEKVHYAWIERQRGGDPLDWVSVHSGQSAGE